MSHIIHAAKNLDAVIITCEIRIPTMIVDSSDIYFIFSVVQLFYFLLKKDLNFENFALT